MKSNTLNRTLSLRKTKTVQQGNRLAIAAMIAAILGLGLGTSSAPFESARLAPLDRETRIAPPRLNWKNQLGNSRTGRVLLHTVCLIRHPQKATWHWRGILREFAA